MLFSWLLSISSCFFVIASWCCLNISWKIFLISSMVILVDPMITFPELMADYYFDDLLTMLTNLSYLIIFSMSLIFRERERKRERETSAINNVRISNVEDHFWMLPKVEKVSNLIRQQCHIGCAHGGRGATLNELRSSGYSTHLRQNFLYSEEINKNPAWLFGLPYLNVFLIYQYHYQPKKKIYWAKKTKVWWRHFCYDIILS